MLFVYYLNPKGVDWSVQSITICLLPNLIDNPSMLLLMHMANASDQHKGHMQQPDLGKRRILYGRWAVTRAQRLRWGKLAKQQPQVQRLLSQPSTYLPIPYISTPLTWSVRVCSGSAEGAEQGACRPQQTPAVVSQGSITANLLKCLDKGLPDPVW